MATRIFKNSVFNFIGKCFFHSLSVIACIVVTLWKLGLLITSPLWFPVMIMVNSDRAARGLNDKYQRDGSLEPAYLDWVVTCVHNVCIYYLMRWLWTPFIALLPMRYRDEFIQYSAKPLHDYSTKTQVAFYKHCDDGGKQNMLAYGDLSQEARTAIWEDESERENWVDSNCKLSKEQVNDLIVYKCSALLCRYFKRNTPDKEMLNLLIKTAHQGYDNAMKVLIYLIKQQRPNADLLSKLLTVENVKFQQSVEEIIANYADLDAVLFSISGGMPEEEIKKIEREYWENFCRNQAHISVAAQKQMSLEQYEVFAETGHQLDYAALQFLCSHIGNEAYLKAIVEHEYEQIDSRLVTALKSEYWRYSVYLAVKQERETAKK